VGLGDRGDDGQAEAGAVGRARTRGVEAAERLEQLRHALGRNLGARVAHGQPIARIHLDLDRAALVVVADRVVQQVRHELAEEHGIAPDGERPGGQPYPDAGLRRLTP
jgi:hypothetical protein